jgi:methionyl-tRNA synthetase
MTPENILVCVAWPYANGDLHVGHVAGAYLPADIFARYHRLKGNRVVMVSGSDAHGTPITVKADQTGTTPRAVFEHYHARFLETQKNLGISYDLFTHTDTRNHHWVSQQMFLRLLENEYLYQGKSQQLYSEAQKRFLPDRFVEGTCPICGYDKARGDQCDNCGNLLDAVQLINPRSRIDGSVPVVRETEHYFLDLPALKRELVAYLGEKDFWRANVLNFSRNYAQNVAPRAITRDLDWGIQVPLPNQQGKCIYVWFEALIGYLSAAIEWAQLTGQPEAWKEFWYGPDARIYNFIGKDNIPFHTVIWPAELLGAKSLAPAAADGEREGVFNLPYDVPANQYLNLGGQKFSKSLGVSLEVIDLAAKYGADPVRFYLASIMPEGKDADWNWADFAQTNNSVLLAKWGNLAQRTLSQIWRNFDQRIPAPGELTEADRALIARSEAAFDTVGAALAAVKLRDALNGAIELATATNQYLDGEAPWKTIKADKARAGTQLYVAARVIDSLSVLLAPFIPGVCEAVRRQLGHSESLFGVLSIEEVGAAGDRHNVLRYDAATAQGAWKPSALQAGQPLGSEPKGLIAKIEIAA